ncbi:hypothetical protein [Rhizobium ruizarguesonis]|uniref:hypothetical protein n=1 Tax=Rhizobium ruizarguesonis TaxID=2081791 RepID=UPI0037C5B081
MSTDHSWLAAAKALPDAVQVADRWHLMENASRAFLDSVRKSMRQIRKTLGATRVNPKLQFAVCQCIIRIKKLRVDQLKFPYVL